MKKIIRIASVIALASASLLYVGCTKDFSADLAKTNSEVAAQASKVAALEATVQTINSTVENLKTTKADAAAVNALKEDLESKINTLTSALEQTALLAASAKADAEAVAADLEVEKAKLDSIILVVDTLAIKSDSLRKDVDSLYKNSADFETRIAELEGKVEDIAVRITSINAKPSLSPQIQCFAPDTVGASDPDPVYAFVANFDIQPKSAISEITKENLKVIFKTGLDRYLNGNAGGYVKDSAYNVISVVPNVKNGSISVIAKVDYAVLKSDNTVCPYFSLVYSGKDKAGDYAVASSYTKVNEFGDTQYLQNVLAVVDNVTGEGLSSSEKTVYIDTISYAETEDTVFTTAFNGRCTIKAKFNGNYISLTEFAKVLGGTEKTQFPIDTTVDLTGLILFGGTDGSKLLPAVVPYTGDDATYYAAKVMDGKEDLAWRSKGFWENTKESDLNGIWSKDSVKFYKISKTDNLYYGNRTTVKTKVKVNDEEIADIRDRLYIGAKNKGTFNLGTSTEDWYYDFAKSAIKDSFVVKNADAAKALGDSALTVTTKDGVFSVKGDKAEKVQVNVAGVKYAKVAADTTYSVNWATTANITKKADSTFSAFNWALKVGPRPADPETIKFAVDTTVRGTKSITAKFKIFANSIAAVDELDNRVKFGTPEIKSITINGKALDLKKNDPAKRFSFASVEDGEVTFLNAAEGTTVVVATAKCAGITFTYEFTLNLTKGATPTFKALTTYVEEKDGKYVVSVSAPKIEKSKSRSWEGRYNYQGRYVESLNTIPFNQLFVVDTTNFASKDVFAAFDRNVDSTASEIKAHESFFTLPGDLKVTDDKVTFEKGTDIDWGTYDSLQVNVIAYLVIPGADKEYNDTIDQIDINFWTAEPIKSVEHVDSTISHNNTKGDVVDLAGLFTMKDYNDSTVWANGKPYAKGTFYYGQEIEFAQDVKKWTINGDIAAGTLTIDGTVLTLAPQGADIQKPVTVEIPFVVKHDLDKFGKAAADRQGTVKVTFTSEK